MVNISWDSLVWAFHIGLTISRTSKFCKSLKKMIELIGCYGRWKASSGNATNFTSSTRIKSWIRISHSLCDDRQRVYSKIVGILEPIASIIKPIIIEKMPLRDAHWSGWMSTSAVMRLRLRAVICPLWKMWRATTRKFKESRRRSKEYTMRECVDCHVARSYTSTCAETSWTISSSGKVNPILTSLLSSWRAAGRASSRTLR